MICAPVDDQPLHRGGWKEPTLLEERGAGLLISVSEINDCAPRYLETASAKWGITTEVGNSMDVHRVQIADPVLKRLSIGESLLDQSYSSNYNQTSKKGGFSMSKKKTRYVVPFELIKEASGGKISDESQELKLKNGEEFTDRQVGALYGSSIEFNITANVTVSPAGELYCPADSSLRQKMKPKRQFGEFAAFKEDSAVIANEVCLGRSIAELSSVDQIKLVADDFDKLTMTKVTDAFVYRDTQGQRLTFDQLMSWHNSNRSANKLIQDEKTQLIKEFGCAPSFKDGKWINPEYPEDLLSGLKEINRRLKSPTGIFVNVTLTGVHTIAKDSRYFGGKLEQDQLDELASKLNYKEHNSFYSGKVRRKTISIPIQNEGQLRSVFAVVQDKDTWRIRNTASGEQVKFHVLDIERN